MDVLLQLVRRIALAFTALPPELVTTHPGTGPVMPVQIVSDSRRTQLIGNAIERVPESALPKHNQRQAPGFPPLFQFGDGRLFHERRGLVHRINHPYRHLPSRQRIE